MPKTNFPSSSAGVPHEAPPLVAAALRSVEDIVSKSGRAQRYKMLRAYWEGTQYNDKAFNWDGSYKLETDGIGVPAYPRDPAPLNERCMPARYPVAEILVDELSSLLFGEGRFPRVKVEDDPDSEEFLKGIEEGSQARVWAKQMRDVGGALSRVFVSYQWVGDGEPRVEIHDPRDCVVLDWADLHKGIPRHVLKLWTVREPSVRNGRLVELDVWLAREWCGPKGDENGTTVEAGADRVYRYHAPTDGGDPYWELLTSAPIDECPVIAVLNQWVLGQHEGRGDFEGHEGLIDNCNIVLNAAAGGVARNIDPTLVLHMDPAVNNGKEIKKGGYNTIFAEKGASLLEMSGSTTTTGLEMTDRLRTMAFESSHFTVLDPEKIGGAAQSGEAMRRLMFRTLGHVATLRVAYGTNGLVRVYEGLLRQAQRLVKKPPPPVPVRDDDGQVVLNADGTPKMQTAGGYRFKLPPKVTRETVKGPDGRVQEKVKSIEDRVPGIGTMITLDWPDPYPASSTDKLADAQVITTLNGGSPVISQKTGVEMARPMTNVIDAEQELADITDGERLLADARAGSMGMPPQSGQKAPNEHLEG